jgi:hypothetical protein
MSLPIIGHLLFGVVSLGFLVAPAGAGLDVNLLVAVNVALAATGAYHFYRLGVLLA